ARPAMSNFTFTPPPGAKVKTVKMPAGHPGVMPRTGMPGEPGMFHSPGAKISHGHAPLGGARTFGSGWLTVVAIPVGALTHMPAAGPAHPGIGPSGGVSRSGPFSGGPGQARALLGVLLKAATPVHGSWGSGRLLRTSLL